VVLKVCHKNDSSKCQDCLQVALAHIPTQAPILSWEDQDTTNDEIRIVDNDPAKYDYTLVKEHENLADVARRVYGSNNVVNRAKLDLANNGNIFGWIRIPR
jgi:hypothetical protein